MSDRKKGLEGEGLSPLQLLAQLWLREPDWAMVKLAHDQFGFPDSDPAELAGAFTDLFLLNVPPYGSVFLDSPSELNGSSAGDVRRVFAESGFEPAELAEVAAPDHLGLLIRWADGHETGRLDLSWIPSCCLAVQREPTVHPFYAGLAVKTLEWAPTRTSETGDGEFSDSLLLAIRGGSEDDEVGLGRVVRFLLTPARSGMYLSRGRIGAIAVELGLRLPFGSRFDVARSLFVAAGESEITAKLFEVLQAEVSWWEESCDRLARAEPGWYPVAGTWKSRLGTMRELLEAMREIADA